MLAIYRRLHRGSWQPMYAFNLQKPLVHKGSELRDPNSKARNIMVLLPTFEMPIQYSLVIGTLRIHDYLNKVTVLSSL